MCGQRALTGDARARRTEPTIDDPDCIPPPVVTEASTEHSSTTEGPSGSASDSSGYNGGGGGGVRYITLPTDNGGSEFVPTDEVHYAPAPAPALTDSEINGLIGQISSDFNGFDNMYWKGNRPVAGGPGSAPAPAPTVMLGPGGTAPGDVTVQENFLTPVQQKQLHDLIVVRAAALRGASPRVAASSRRPPRAAHRH